MQSNGGPANFEAAATVWPDKTCGNRSMKSYLT